MNAKRILCPVDLSENSMAAVDVATALAKQGNGTIVFLYVAPEWLPEESMVGSDYVDSVIDEHKQELAKLKPTDESVGFEYLFLQGNAGPEIVRAAKSCDMVVMSTHGYSGVMRLMMGNVAQYASRHADCPVILVKNPRIKKKSVRPAPKQKRPVTDAMHQVGAIQGDDHLNDVIRMFSETRETAAPVVDSFNKCIGILTTTDIENYRKIKARYDAGDESVVGEVFETNAYGQRRTEVEDFHQVHRHMTAPVVTISNNEFCYRAREIFEIKSDIHHLVVVDDSNHPVGILESRDVVQSKPETSDA